MSTDIVTWGRRPEELLHRRRLDGLTGRLELDVPQDGVGLLFRGGALLETLSPGRHILREKGSEGGWFRRAPQPDASGPSEVVYVWTGALDVECLWGGDQAGPEAVYAADQTPCRVMADLVIRVEDPQRFAREALTTEREAFAQVNLAQMIERRFRAVISQAAATEPLIGVASFESLRARMEHTLTDERPEFWRNMGLRLERVTQLQVLSPAATEVLQGEADLRWQARGLEQREARNRLDRREQQLRDLAEIMERKDESEKLSMLRDLDKQDLASEQELAAAAREMREENEDHAIARDHFKNRIELLNENELEVLHRKHVRQQEKEGLAHDLELDQARSEWDLRKQAQEGEAQSQLKRLQTDDDAYEGLKGLDILEKTKRVAREDEQAREAHRVSMIKDLAQQGIATLIAGVDDVQRAQMLGKMAEEQAMQGLSEEQILARVAAGSPDVARIFQEKFKAQGSDRMEAMYREMRGDQEQFRQELLSMFQVSVAAQRDSATGVAQGRPGGAGGAASGPFTGSSAAASTAALLCRKCNQENGPNMNFCGNCGEKLRGH